MIQALLQLKAYGRIILKRIRIVILNSIIIFPIVFKNVIFVATRALNYKMIWRCPNILTN